MHTEASVNILSVTNACPPRCAPASVEAVLSSVHHRVPSNTREPSIQQVLNKCLSEKEKGGWSNRQNGKELWRKTKLSCPFRAHHVQEVFLTSAPAWLPSALNH